MRGVFRNFQSSRGTALFLILVAVALFAALAYAIANSGRGSGNINREQATLDAAQVVAMTGMMKATVDRMVISGTPLASIKINSGGYNAPCTTGTNCIFSLTGGGLTVPQHKAIAAVRYAEPSDGFSVSNVGTAANDLFIIFDVSGEVCTAINKALGLTVPPAVDAVDSIVAGGTPYAGEYIFCESYSFASTGYSYVLVLGAF